MTGEMPHPVEGGCMADKPSLTGIQVRRRSVPNIGAGRRSRLPRIVRWFLLFPYRFTSIWVGAQSAERNLKTPPFGESKVKAEVVFHADSLIVATVGSSSCSA